MLAEYIIEYWTPPSPNSPQLLTLRKVFPGAISDYYLETYLHNEASKASPGVAHYYEQQIVDGYLSFRMEYCLNGDLRKLWTSMTEEDTQLMPKQLYSWAESMLTTLREIHSARIAHRNIKLSNWVLDSACQLKLIGFARAKLVQEAISLDIHTYQPNPSMRSPEIRSIGADEQFTYSNVFKEDVWNLGKVIYQLATEGEAHELNRIGSRELWTGIASKLKSRGYEKLVNTLIAMLKATSESRPTAREALELLRCDLSDRNSHSAVFFIYPISTLASEPVRNPESDPAPSSTPSTPIITPFDF